MEVSSSGYYAWRKRLTKPPCLKRKRLADLVRHCYFENRRRYGARRIAKALAKNGTRIGRCEVRRLMSEENLKAITAKAFKPRTTDSTGTTAAPNLLAEIKLEECAPTKIIKGFITYIRLRGGKFCYLAIWQDKVTRRIIGWSLSMEMTAELIISALQKAIRKGLVKAGAIVHSDRGSQYAPGRISPTFAAELFAAINERQRQRFATTLNAISFFSRFKAELIEGGVFEDLEQARSEIFSYIEGYCNLGQITFEFGLQESNGI